MAGNRVKLNKQKRTGKFKLTFTSMVQMYRTHPLTENISSGKYYTLIECGRHADSEYACYIALISQMMHKSTRDNDLGLLLTDH